MLPQSSPKNKSTGPLDGIVVLDITRVLAGPYCTMILKDLGARIIKVELPEAGDDSRRIGPFIKGRSAYFMSLNRGKESIALNLKDERDKQIFERLLGRSDVLVENFRAGTMENMGFGWKRLKKEFPDLIYASTSGFGHTGPYAGKPAYDLVVQAMGGIMSLTGQPGSGPVRVGTSIGDLAAGLFAAVGICSALFHRQQTAKSLKVDVAMLDCQVALLENAIARYFATGSAPGLLGARHPSIAPFDAFKTKDGHIVVTAGNDSLFQKLTHAIGVPELANAAEYSSNDLRSQNVEALKRDLERKLKTNTTAHWIGILEDAGVPCGPINNVEHVLNDPQVKARNMVVTAHDPVAGGVKMTGNPIKFDEFEDPETRDSSPALDENREAILKFLDKT